MSYILKITSNKDDDVYDIPLSTGIIKKPDYVELYDNMHYEIQLFNDGIEIPYEKLFINKNGLDEQKKNTFEGYFGWVQISVKNQEGVFLSSGYIYIMPKDKKVLEQLHNMVFYITKRSQKIKFPNKIYELFGINSKGINKNFSTVSLLKVILDGYEENYKHFFANSRVKLTNVNVVDNIERLKSFSLDTVSFISTHPQYLAEEKSKTGISYNGKSYLPQKTLVSSSEYSFDNYENRIVLGFLKYIIDQLKTKSFERYQGFAYFCLNALEGKKEVPFNEHSELLKKYCIIYEKYKKLFGFSPETVINTLPQMTHIFKNVHHYRNIYKYMRLFFLGGTICPSPSEKVMWYLDTSSRIYEYYVFLKLGEKIEEAGYTRAEIKPSKRNESFPEYIYYEKGTEKKYLYFQPEIPYADFWDYNCGVSLQRFTPVSFYSDKDSAKEYTPDYVIKTVDKNGNETCEIADAKFSDFNTVRDYYMPPSVFKYLASVEAINGAKISGLTLYYCKGDEKELKEHPTIKKPSVKIVHLSE